VNGNIGNGAGAVENLGGAGISISGHIFFENTIVPGTNLLASGGSFSIDGGSCPAAGNGANCLTNTGTDGQALIQQQSALVGSADTALTNMYNAASSLAPNTTVSTLTDYSKNTVNGLADTWVVDVTGGTSLSAGHHITLTGESSDFFIFNIGNGGLSGSAAEASFSVVLLQTMSCSTSSAPAPASHVTPVIAIRAIFTSAGRLLAPGSSWLWIETSPKIRPRGTAASSRVRTRP